ncbi:unnamed protein product [Protopolystoma xenopodis]|uniref:Uncharacterized protein n=1 Tax=Protopolystoma xenopodis TaxID=117903 RepID=A0A3S5AAK1_9PLAT|nr:unnamed protein product [Protopolystoma xenopodis]
MNPFTESTHSAPGPTGGRNPPHSCHSPHHSGRPRIPARLSSEDTLSARTRLQPVVKFPGHMTSPQPLYLLPSPRLSLPTSGHCMPVVCLSGKLLLAFMSATFCPSASAPKHNSPAQRMYMCILGSSFPSQPSFVYASAPNRYVLGRLVVMRPSDCGFRWNDRLNEVKRSPSLWLVV